MLAGLLFQAAWVAVLLHGAQGRVYTGRRKLANFAVERRRIGPHICLSGFGSGCCPGWIPSPGSGQCTLPLCSFGCGSGFCIAPNVCACRDGRQGITCQDLPGACGEYGCDLTCNHGGCQEVARVCPLGFSMTETANGVRCVDIDECLSASCEGLCVNTEGGFVCECGPGMQLATDRHSCQDIDECLTTPCQQHCQNSIGSYQCSCHSGFYLHGNRHSCVDVNECRRPSDKRTCQHSCHNTLGSFMCSCHPGYRLSVDRLSCEGKDCHIVHRTIKPSRSFALHQLFIYLSLKGTPFPFPLIPILSVLPSTASPTSSSPPHSSSFGTSFWPRTARPSLPVSPLSPLLPKKFSPSISPSPLTPSLPSACWHGGVLHEDNSSWTEPPCLNCSCEGGQVFCQTVTCEVSCSHPIPPAQGECCPTCTGCFYYGMSRIEGDVFSLSEENCTVCVCLAGNISCISPECTPSPCPSSAQTDCCPCQPAECHFRGQIYIQGTEFNPDGDNCTICVCRINWPLSEVAKCTEVVQSEQHLEFNGDNGCEHLEFNGDNGCEHLEFNGDNGCEHLGGCFIDDNGIEFPVGQLWSPGDPCELCICQTDGSVSCKRTDCLEMCPHPIQIPGQCCPDCSAGCTYAGKIFYNNETFPSVLDPCLSCICLLGSVACSPMDCVVSCTYPFHPEGECCPICHDCNYRGRKVINGHNFVPEDEPCVYCTCQLGEVSCERKTCPKTCTEPFGPLTHCCLDCQNNEVMGDLASLENRLANPVLEDAAVERSLQTLQRGPMTLVSDSSTPNHASFTPEDHLEASNANDQETVFTKPIALGNVGLHQSRPGEATRLHLNEPPSIIPPSWLGHLAIPQIKPESIVSLLNNPESFGDPPRKSTGSFMTHSSLSFLYSRTGRTTASPPTAHISIPSTPAYLKKSITALFQGSNTHNLPLQPLAETFSSSANSNLDSLQELPSSPTHFTYFSLGQQNAGNNSKLTSSDDNSLTDISP
ncbi:von Willebrand factor C and EGF domain-containing protein [Ahaetulla prasina]|uniref:von Willebrand factor C and EGF domain-containing protein n=1 Tax=Ahaetulla prasina TaxID=499056 RepID=UPI0026488FB8|nr:von Willebrand factor C and EGF domain-containing protein [Ahaetulla prasina]